MSDNISLNNISAISVTLPLPRNVQEQICDGITVAARSFNILLPENTEWWFFDPDPKGDGAAILGGLSPNESTMREYLNILRQLWRFLAWIGDYESMLMLVQGLKHEDMPIPAMRIESIILFLRFKRCFIPAIPPDVPEAPKLLTLIPYLQEEEEGDDVPVISDIFNNTIYCDGRWKAPKRADVLHAAISFLHQARGFGNQKV